MSVSEVIIRAAWRRALGVALTVLLCGSLCLAASATLAHGANREMNGCRAGLQQVDGRCLSPARTVTLPATASSALRLAFSSDAGRTALLNVFRSHEGMKAGGVATPTHGALAPDWTCPAGSCGVSRSGGWHFWAVVSYASFFNVGAFPFWYSCTGALSPFVTPIGATAACGGVTGTLWALANNEPRYTNHGVWVAVYWNHISGGRY